MKRITEQKSETIEQERSIEQDLEKLVKRLSGPDAASVLKFHAFERLEVDVRTIREVLGLTRQEFAFRYDLSLRTIENWEEGRREPEGPAKSYLVAIAFAPEAVAQAIKAYHDGKLPDQNLAGGAGSRNSLNRGGTGSGGDVAETPLAIPAHPGVPEFEQA